MHRERTFFPRILVHYTNAPLIISQSFKDTEDLKECSRLEARAKILRSEKWLYEGAEREKAWRKSSHGETHGGHGQHGSNVSPDLNNYKTDNTLQDPRCVFQLLKKHFARYTPQMVEEYCGISHEAFTRVADTYCKASAPIKPAAFAMRLAGRNIPPACK